MFRRGFLPIALCALTGALAAAPAHALDLDWKNRVSTHKEGPYQQFKKIHLGVGHTKTVYWQVRSTGQNDHDLSFYTSTQPYGHYKVHWFKGKKEITNKVEGSGYDFTLKAGTDRYFRSTIKRTQSSEDSGCVDGNSAEGSSRVIAEVGVNTTCVF